MMSSKSYHHATGPIVCAIAPNTNCDTLNVHGEDDSFISGIGLTLQSPDQWRSLIAAAHEGLAACEARLAKDQPDGH
jgi:hypothetical protein